MKSIMRTFLVMFITVIAFGVVACQGETKPPYYGAFIKHGRDLIELTQITAFGTPSSNELQGIPITADPRPVIVLWQPDTQLQYLQLVSTSPRQEFRYNATPKQDGVLELQPSDPLANGRYCFIQGNPLSMGLPAWCFQIGSELQTSMVSPTPTATNLPTPSAISQSTTVFITPSPILEIAAPESTSAHDNRETSSIAPGVTTLVSVASDGTQGTYQSGSPSISADGRYVAFESWARNLVPGDGFFGIEVYVHDRQTGQTTHISVAPGGTPGYGGSSYTPSISADGRYVAFASNHHNLVPGDTNGVIDIFVHDRQTGQTKRVSVASDGTQGDGESRNPSISANGRYVAFESRANNLVPDGTTGSDDIYVHDLQTGQTSRVSIASDGTRGNNGSYNPSISADGRYVAFWSHAGNLSPGGIYQDIFVHDRQTGQTSRVSVASDGTAGNNGSVFPSISADGRYVAFVSSADNLVTDDTNDVTDVFVHDRQTGETVRASVASDGTQGNGESYWVSISADGRYVVFDSSASNLAPDDANDSWDIFVHDLQTRQTIRISVASNNTQGNGNSGGEYYYGAPSVSGDGRYIAFWSEASNLVPGDTNGVVDVFVHELDILPVVNR